MQTEKYEVEFWKEKAKWEARTKESLAFMLGCQAPVLFMVFKQMLCSIMDWMDAKEITEQVN